MNLMTKVMETVAKIAPDRAPDALREAHRQLGRPVDRLDGHAKVTGAARFAGEHHESRMVYAALVYSRIAHGRIAGIDATAALAMTGVVAVVTHLNAPKMAPPPLFDPSGASTDMAGTAIRVLNTDGVFWNGQPVAIVVADTQDRADDAAARVTVSYDQEAAATSFTAEKPKQKKPDKILSEDTEVRKGDAEAALAAAPVRVDAVYTTPFLNHNAIEPHAVTAAWQGDDRLVLHSASQFLQGEAGTLAKIFGLADGAVHVLSPFVGGGFGGKGATWPHVWLCALAAKVVQRPVRLALSREGVYRVVGGRTCSEQRVALGARADGTLTALIHSGVTANATDNDWPEQFTFPARHLYAMPAYLITQAVTRLHMTANTAMRAPGESIGTFALESALDELAATTGIDPVELRLRNEPAVDPVKGTPFSSRHLDRAFALGAERFGWKDRPAAPRSQRDGEWWVGQGVATAFYPYYRMPTSARVRIHADGTARVQTSAHEMGMGTATAQTQAAAERFGLPMEKVRFEYGDSTLPFANQAGGSSQTVSLALAVQQAFEKVQKELLSLAGKGDGLPLAGAGADDVEARNGGLFRRDGAGAGETYAAILARAGKAYVEAEVKTGPPLETMKYSMQSYGAQFCEVRVNETTGEVRVARWVAAFDTGRIVNPKTACSQFRGGIIMGIGMALAEETLLDERSGRIMNPSLAEYHLPVNADVPEIDVLFVDMPDPHTPLGAHGVGEIGITGTAAAIANAIYHATGKRIRSLPITLDKLL